MLSYSLLAGSPTYELGLADYIHHWVVLRMNIRQFDFLDRYFFLVSSLGLLVSLTS